MGLKYDYVRSNFEERLRGGESSSVDYNRVAYDMSTFVHSGMAATLVATPWWLEALHAISNTLSFVSVTCGAIIGVTTVYRMYRRKK